MASSAQHHQNPQNDVNTDLTPKSRAQSRSTNRPGTSRRRRKEGVENTDYAAIAPG